jgi:APA family basic amino acid/polyamine antiporter
MSEAARPLSRILGLGFGLAIVFGGTVGTGILVLPGTLAAALGDSRLIVLFWILGGVWALLGAVSVAELAAMLPEAGGFYVYAKRAFGGGLGFIVGWIDWLNQVCALSYAALTVALFFGQLLPAVAGAPKWVALGTLAVFTTVHWLGLKIGSTVTNLISLTVALMLLLLVVGCFASPGIGGGGVPPAGSAVNLPLLSLGMLSVVVTALRNVFVSYDGWYSAIYTAEESTDPARTLPRAMIGGAVLIAAIYVLVNVAILRVLPIPVLAASHLPAADAASVVMPHGGRMLVTVISLTVVLSLVNATLLMTPRILFAIGRDGFFTEKAAVVSRSGTPRVALGVTAAAAAVLSILGSFEQIVAIAAVMFLLLYLSCYAALFTLRRREPSLHRPYRAWGYPVTTSIVLVGCFALWVAAIAADQASALRAAGLLVLCVPVYLWLKRRRQA